MVFISYFAYAKLFNFDIYQKTVDYILSSRRRIFTFVIRENFRTLAHILDTLAFLMLSVPVKSPQEYRAHPNISIKLETMVRLYFLYK